MNEERVEILKRASYILQVLLCFLFIYILFSYLFFIYYYLLQGFTINGKCVLDSFLKVKETFKISTNAIVKLPPTILIHFCLEDIEHIAYFTIIQQLMAEYYINGKSKL